MLLFSLLVYAVSLLTGRAQQDGALQAGMTRAQWGLAEMPLEEFTAFDSDGNGVLDADEFARWELADGQEELDDRQEGADLEVWWEAAMYVAANLTWPCCHALTSASRRYFVDFARFAELCWLVGLFGLMLKLIKLRSQPRMTQQKELRMISTQVGVRVVSTFTSTFTPPHTNQSVLMYGSIFVIKYLLPHTWRFHEARFLDAPSAACAGAPALHHARTRNIRLLTTGDPRLASTARPSARLTAHGAVGVCLLLGAMTGWEVEALGAELLWRLWPSAGTHPVGKRLLPALERSALPLACLLAAAAVHAARPSAVRRDDDRVGTWPLWADFLSILDLVAILPQFVKIRESRKAGDQDGGGAVGGRGAAGGAEDSAVAVPPVLSFWLCCMAWARVMGFLSGLLNAGRDLIGLGQFNVVEWTYVGSSGFNLLLLGEFAYHALRALFSRQKEIVLPM
jgi:hypothetical protein